jgi:hypothetical protein
MTSPSSPPSRRRRRIVLLTIAVLVLGLGWWVRPRVDQRFAGRWQLVDEEGTELDEFWTLRSTGLCLLSYFPSDPGHEYFMWSVDSNEFVIGNDLNRWSGVIGPIVNSFNRWSDSVFQYGQGAQRFEISQVTPQEIVLVQAGRKTMLRRVVETNAFPKSTSPPSGNPVTAQ